jgi:hypothetical protein
MNKSIIGWNYELRGLIVELFMLFSKIFWIFWNLFVGAYFLIYLWTLNLSINSDNYELISSFVDASIEVQKYQQNSFFCVVCSIGKLFRFFNNYHI